MVPHLAAVLFVTLAWMHSQSTLVPPLLLHILNLVRLYDGSATSHPVKADRKAANSSVFSAGRDRVRVWMIGKQAWLAATVPLDHLISLSRVVLLVRVANHVLCPITCCHRLATNLGKDCPCMHISTLYPLFQLFSALQD